VSVFTRRRLLLAAGAAAGAVGIEALWLEPRRVTVTRHRVGGGSRPLRVVQLSDLHLQGIHQFEIDVASTVSNLTPDVIVLTGDSIDKRDRHGVLDEFLGALPAQTPKYAVLGNWDYWSRAPVDEQGAVYERHHCRLLINETVVHEYNGRSIRITGADDLIGGKPDLGSLTPAASDETHVLLAHCPAYRERVERLAPGRFTCMLSGHTHGGQVRFLGFAPILPRGSGGYVSGWYRGRSRLPMYVSRGIGTSLIRARLGAPPEISVFEIG
jgi:predicted MPP superfamily phosphohydrolase